MGMSAEQQSLLNQINERVAEVREAIRRALPGNAGLHEEFRVGAPPAATPAEAIEAGRQLAPLAKEYRSLLIGRGIDQAKVAHLASMVATLERLAPAPVVEPAPAPEPPPPAPGAPTSDGAEQGRKPRRRK